TARLPNNTVYDISLDVDDNLWVGTENGVAVFANATQFPEKVERSFLPVFEETGFLFRNQRVNCIASDPGKRKWVGTNSGLYLLNSSGSEQEQHFTVENSPLLSNTVLDLVINDATGEIFIATDKGLISYRADLSMRLSSHQNVSIFPNPVRGDYEGLLGIQGLVADAILSITDVSGKKIYETRSNGSTATWNLRDYRDQRAEPGVYLVFSTDAEGQETFVGKFAVVR
ncbi:MAG: T9SS type A sorting domain-containing protein, partial [Cytophagales bacterium]|nr:T9SS type A sorting domain-containing protein [Cytophagales bacterium]